MAIDLDSQGEDEIVASINTTPLVDVMLVLLIIFLITIPVVVHTHRVVLPKESTSKQVLSLQDINLAITRSGQIYWKDQLINRDELNRRLASIGHSETRLLIRADENTTYHFIGDVLHACHQAGIAKIEFITEPTKK